MEKPSALRRIFGRPMPAPKPRSRASSLAVESLLHGFVNIRDAGAHIPGDQHDVLRIHLHGELSAQAVDDQVQFGFVAGDRHAPEYRTSTPSCLSLRLMLAEASPAVSNSAFVHVIGIG